MEARLKIRPSCPHDLVRNLVFQPGCGTQEAPMLSFPGETLEELCSTQCQWQ